MIDLKKSGGEKISLTQTPNSLRTHIAIFGKPNSGKSSLINKITKQNLSIISPVKGTTTDPVKKAMELEGMCSGIIKEPLVELNEEKTKRLVKAIDKYRNRKA